MGSEQSKLGELQASVEGARTALSRVTSDLAAQRIANTAAHQQLERKRCGARRVDGGRRCQGGNDGGASRAA